MVTPLNTIANRSCSQDKLIISTAVPQITNTFHSADDIGWYGTAYLLTNCAFLLVFGKLYSFLNVKWTFLTAVVLFEIGSAICGAAPNSISFIIGRAIAGLGAGGVQSGVVGFPLPSLPLKSLSPINSFNLRRALNI
jgi:MFS family permease